MGQSIDDYRAKRDFERTPEPPPGEERPPGGSASFVVHRHEARNLHYDLRLEMAGVLRSWAVPKGFSYDPAQKRLAVRTEDHPLEYLDFHGTIPKGQYGAGSMTIWDRGRYEVVAGADGSAAVEQGELKVVLRGRRLRGEWHLVRTRREGEQDHWLLFKSKDRYAGDDRDSCLGVDLAAAPEGPLPADLEPMRCGSSAAPFSDPEWLFEARLEGRRVLARKRGEELHLRGLDPAQEETARDALAAALGDLRAEDALLDGVLVATDELQRPSRDALERRLARQADGPLVYYAFDLLGWEDYDLRGLPLLERKAALRAVLPKSEVLLFVDHVAGEGEELVEAVRRAGLPAVIAKRAEGAYVPGAAADWREIPVEGADGAADLDLLAALERGGGPRRPSRVRFTNPGKVFWPDTGATKGDLIAYFAAVAEYLLPHLRGRVVHMNRYPDGIEGKSFYQRHAKEDTPDWVRTVRIASESRGEELLYPVCDDRDTLLWLGNQGSIDLHPWLSRVDTPDSPDWCVLDLDAKESPFGDVVKIARVAGRVLRGIGLRPLVKTSGATGMHVFVPLMPGYSYEQSRMFCEGIARLIARELPDISTVERNPARRGGKVYLDYGQNRKSQTIVPPYVPRPRPGAPVSAPLDWDEVDSSLSPGLFTIETMPARLEQHGDLFRAALTDRQDLLPAIEALQQDLGRGKP